MSGQREYEDMSDFEIVQHSREQIRGIDKSLREYEMTREQRNKYVEFKKFWQGYIDKGGWI